MAKDLNKTIAYKDLRNSGGGGEIPFVAVHEAQSFDDTQKTQARNNIGAGTSSFSGDYNDLSNKPTIPTVNNATLTIQKNGSTVKTFTANASSNVTANIVETKLSKGTTSGSGNAVTDITVSDHKITLTKGSTFLTEHQSIKTVNGQSIVGTGDVTISGGVEEAPIDDYVYARYQGQWVKNKYITPLTDGVWIGYTDGTVSPYNEAPDPVRTVKGVVLKNNKVCICIHKTQSGQRWCNTSTKIDGVTTTTSKSTAKTDYNGKANTDAALSSGYNCPAFTWARNFGNEWYLPACGEMYQIKLNVAHINTALGLIYGSPLEFNNEYGEYLSSTQYDAQFAWLWRTDLSEWGYSWKSNTNPCRAVCAFN